MKKVKDVQREIDVISNEIKTTEMKKSVENKLRKKIQHLRRCILYLETEPSIEFINKEIRAVQNKINLRMAQFVLDDIAAMPKSVVAKLKRLHEKQYDVVKLREQLRTLKYLKNE